MAQCDNDGDLVIPRRRAPQPQPPTTSVDASALVQLIQSGVIDVRGETVVELACSACAAASIAAAQCGARHVYATDGGGDGNHSLREAVANAKKLGTSDTMLSVRRLDPIELPRLLCAQPEEGADSDALDLDWTAADLRELRRARVFLGGSRLLGPPPAKAELEAGPAACAEALLQACRTWAAGGTASAAAEVEARRWLSGGGGSAGSAADAEAVALALSAVLQGEAEGGARTLLLAVEVERDEDGTGSVGEADGIHGFRWRSEAPPPRLGARLRCLMAAGLEACWAPATSRLPSTGHGAGRRCGGDVFLLRVRACEGSTSRKRPRREARDSDSDGGDDDENGDENGDVPASSPYYGYAVAPGAAPPAWSPGSYRCVQLGGVFGRDALAALDVTLAALDGGGSPRDTTPGFRRATTECLHYGPATAWLFAPVVAALERALAVLGGGPASATAGGRRVEWVTALQYNRYEEGDHFEQLHLDEIAGVTAYKSLAIVIFLSDAAAGDDRGGRFEVGQPPPAPHTRALETPANSAVVFSAQHVAHRVTRVEAGCRRSLVAWATARDVSQQYEQCSRFADVLAACPVSEGEGPSLLSDLT